MIKLINKKNSIIISLFFITFFSNAQVDFVPIADTDSFKSALQNASRNTRTIVCDFIQKRQIALMTEVIISKGQFWFKKPSSIRWEYTEPYKYLIIFSKNKAFVKDDSSSKEYDAQSNQVFKNLGEVMFRFILGDLDAAENDFSVSYKENNTLYFVRLEPLTEGEGLLGPIDLYFDKTDYSLSEIVMYESGEDFTSISFINKTLNENVRNDVFRFQ
ncbi:MAG: outer membrane lipoprotein carrier protein LolA [Bacteroidales bacterium]|nr:outer membrane lipoprotein carrier protein LolA [Bacteroidales bacterium]